MIQKDNDRLQKELNELQQKRKEREELDREVTEPPKRELKKDSRMIPGNYSGIYKWVQLLIIVWTQNLAILDKYKQFYYMNIILSEIKCICRQMDLYTYVKFSKIDLNYK